MIEKRKVFGCDFEVVDERWEVVGGGSLRSQKETGDAPGS